MSASNGAPLRRAQITLRPLDAQQTMLGTSTDEKGHFTLRALPPGRYALEARHEGYLPATTANVGAERLPPVFYLAEKQAIRPIALRLLCAGVIAGKIRFDDAELVNGGLVQVHREYYYRGRHGFTLAASTITNDRGEYRVHDLAPGNYVVAAAYAAPARPANLVEVPRLNADGKPVREEAYTTTFYPSTPKLLQAIALTITPGMEAGTTDITLVTARSVKLSGQVRSALTGAALRGPGMVLRRLDVAGSASIVAPANVTFAEGRFTISGVTPGSYVLVIDGSEAGTRMAARVSLTVGNADIDNLDLLVGPLAEWKGQVILSGEGATRPSGLRIVFEPRSETAATVSAQVESSGTFKVPLVPDERYDVFVNNLPQGAYVQRVIRDGQPVEDDGVAAPTGTPAARVTVHIRLRGAQVSGIVQDAQQPAPGSVVALVPDPIANRQRDYSYTTADQYGAYSFDGLAPGRYTLFAFPETPPCDLYSPLALRDCRALGGSVTLTESSQETVALRLTQ